MVDKGHLNVLPTHRSKTLLISDIRDIISVFKDPSTIVKKSGVGIPILDPLKLSFLSPFDGVLPK